PTENLHRLQAPVLLGTPEVDVELAIRKSMRLPELMADRDGELGLTDTWHARDHGDRQVSLITFRVALERVDQLPDLFFSPGEVLDRGVELARCVLARIADPSTALLLSQLP